MIKPQGAKSRHHARRTGSEAVRYLYPEIEAGGFTRYDHRVIFFARVNALLRKDMTVLDFGAGRGIWAQVESGFRLDLMTLKGKCERLIGADVDPVVLENPLVDEAVVLPADGSIPLPDMSVDMVVSWAVFEHLTDPARAAAELRRILRPGGWICAWTPNKWSYTFVSEPELIPHQFHARVLRYVHPTSKRRERDVFPTFYKLNTLRELRRHFPYDALRALLVSFQRGPSYHANKFFVAAAIDIAAKLARTISPKRSTRSFESTKRPVEPPPLPLGPGTGRHAWLVRPPGPPAPHRSGVDFTTLKTMTLIRTPGHHRASDTGSGGAIGVQTQLRGTARSTGPVGPWRCRAPGRHAGHCHPSGPASRVRAAARSPHR